jgi:hypothetical protein
VLRILEKIRLIVRLHELVDNGVDECSIAEQVRRNTKVQQCGDMRYIQAVDGEVSSGITRLTLKLL